MHTLHKERTRSTQMTRHPTPREGVMKLVWGTLRRGKLKESPHMGTDVLSLFVRTSAEVHVHADDTRKEGRQRERKRNAQGEEASKQVLA